MNLLNSDFLLIGLISMQIVGFFTALLTTFKGRSWLPFLTPIGLSLATTTVLSAVRMYGHKIDQIGINAFSLEYPMQYTTYSWSIGLSVFISGVLVFMLVMYLLRLLISK